MKKQRGSALIVAVFIISAVGSVALGIGRLIYLQIASANAYEKGVYAYYAAESGIEEGFLRYRYNQDTYLPYGDGFSYNDTDSKVFRNNLSLTSVVGGSEDNGIPASDPVNTIFNQVYDLRMNPKVAFLGEDSLGVISAGDEIGGANYSANTSDYVIKRDESKKFNIDLIGSGKYNLYFKPVSGTELKTNSIFRDKPQCVVLEIKIVANSSYTSGGIYVERKKLFKNSTCTYTGVFNTGDTASYADYVVLPEYDLLSDLKGVWGAENISSDSELFIKPIGADIKFLIDQSPRQTGGMTGLNTILTSTGYYMGIRRGLEVDIDRQSGSLYDLFDYVVYKAE